MNYGIDGHSVVVITGAGGGIGRAAARVFGGRGAGVALPARGEEGLDGAAADVAKAGGRAKHRRGGPSAQPAAVGGQAQVPGRRGDRGSGRHRGGGGRRQAAAAMIP
ncbi:SDR family NAD(P)-dependent oxidoreductase [Actinomadura sp. LD22]|uniref:SDR family NAD(P)-dependent oxidoreductase n=1 Tax=Actinomadura physcomitrii TaxID=2650748 RepID=A0A6I4M9R6_9ACTN|nr:SDR family NAD(P)-dependent oxidoreductase [Actinomadura physcomitrii]MWA01670.1 SDR family NAD(P)-dependent oxidoreductase [Actinomadura physcomitrii]